MLLRDGLGSGQLPELCDGGVVHPAADKRQVPLDAYGNQVEHARRGRGRPPVRNLVDQVVACWWGARGRCRLRGVVPVRVVAGPLALLLKECDEFVGQAQLQRVLAVRAHGVMFLAGKGLAAVTRVGHE